jgi:hypothetical protein
MSNTMTNNSMKCITFSLNVKSNRHLDLAYLSTLPWKLGFVLFFAIPLGDWSTLPWKLGFLLFFVLLKGHPRNEPHLRARNLQVDEARHCATRGTE